MIHNGSVFSSYSEEIDNKIGTVYQRGIALKILEHMDRVRNNFSKNLARRWPLELLQNAVDACRGNRGVKVMIEYAGDQVRFRHNGDPFKLDHVLSLINQVSSKKRDNTEAIGRFGTGFMTTFQLSEKVEIDSLVEDGGLGARRFHVTLDRTGRTHEEITDSISNSMLELKNVDVQDDCEYDPDSFNTCFTYHLTDDQSRECARIGIEDLKRSAGYILLFSGGISSIEIRDTRSGGGVHTYERMPEKTFGSISVLPVRETSVEPFRRSENISRYAYYADDSIMVSLPVDTDEMRILPISDITPRLYIEFPMIGSENFPFPAVVNSRFFNPNEPRSGITLVDNVNSTDSAENKEYMCKAVKAYGKFISGLIEAGFNGFENAVTLPYWKPDEQLPESYARQQIERVYKEISGLNIIDTREGRVSLNDPRLKIVNSVNRDEREKLNELERHVSGILVTEGDADWGRVLEAYPLRNGLVTNLEIILKNAGTILSGRGFNDDTTCVKWLAALYDIAMANDRFRGEIVYGYHALFMNQDVNEQDRHMRYKYSDLYRDDVDDEELKDISDILGRKYNSCYRRKDLFDRSYDLRNGSCKICTMSSITQGISTAVDSLLKNHSLGEAEEWEQDVCARLLAWIYEHPLEAERYFPAYSNDVGQARLMTPRATAKLRKEKMEYERNCSELKEAKAKLEDKCSLMEAECRQLKEELEILKRSGPSGAQQDGVYEYSGDYDVLLDANECSFDNDDERDRFCRMVGEGGELYALRSLVQRYMDRGYKAKDEYAEGSDLVRLYGDNGESVTIHRADCGNHKQAGYDIDIVETDSNGSQNTRFVEVKTHTEASMVRNVLRLSNSQMITAACNDDNYEILHVIWDKDRMCGIRAESFVNPIRCIADGRIVNAQEGYIFFSQICPKEGRKAS